MALAVQQQNSTVPEQSSVSSTLTTSSSSNSCTSSSQSVLDTPTTSTTMVSATVPPTCAPSLTNTLTNPNSANNDFVPYQSSQAPPPSQTQHYHHQTSTTVTVTTTTSSSANVSSTTTRTTMHCGGSTSTTSSTTGSTVAGTSHYSGQNTSGNTTGQCINFRDPSTAPIRKLSVDLIKTYKHINEVSGIYSVTLFFGSFLLTPECVMWAVCQLAPLCQRGAASRRPRTHTRKTKLRVHARIKAVRFNQSDHNERGTEHEFNMSVSSLVFVCYPVIVSICQSFLLMCICV